MQLPSSLRVILIGGTSHTGKSTLAGCLACALGWEHRATDKLAKHPGRPWNNDGAAAPPHVRDYYANASADQLLRDVLAHYETNVLPQVQAIVRAHISDPTAGGLVLEGSALWPPFVAPLLSDRVAAVWLTGSDALIAERIHRGSRYAQRPPQEQILIDAFLARTIAFAAALTKSLREWALPAVEVREGEAVESLAGRCLQVITADLGGPETS